MNQKYPVKLDLDSIVRDKASKMKLPQFLINILKKIVRQDELNDLLAYLGETEGAASATKAFEYFNIRLNLVGEENIPREGRFLFASNHPLGGLDGIALAAFLGEKFDGKIRIQVNDILMNVKNMESIFIPVNKHGMQARDTIRQTQEAYRSENQLLVFPAGLCSRKINGKVVDLEWKKTFISRAIEYQRIIIPLFFDGQNSPFFYNMALLRTKLKIKTNIEMLFLPHEMFKKQNATFTLYIGKPIAPEVFDKTKTPQQWAEYVKDIVYSIEKH
jgi:putative hemolysin